MALRIHLHGFIVHQWLRAEYVSGLQYRSYSVLQLARERETSVQALAHFCINLESLLRFSIVAAIHDELILCTKMRVNRAW